MNIPDISSSICTSTAIRSAPALALALAPVLIASGCGARAATPPSPSAVATPAPATAPVTLDDETCVTLAVSDQAARARCDGDAPGPCVESIVVVAPDPQVARVACMPLVITRTVDTSDGEHGPTEENGSYLLTVVEREGSQWAVRAQKKLDYFALEADSRTAELSAMQLGPAAHALLVASISTMGAYNDTVSTLYLMTPQGLSEVLSFHTEVGDGQREEREYDIDDSVVTSGYYDIVFQVKEASEDWETQETSESARVERYRWNGAAYELIDSQTVEGEPSGDDE